MTPIQEPQEVELPRGVVAEASAPLPVIQFPDGSTEPAPAGSVLAEDIIGLLTSEQIEELAAAKISGKLTAEQIEAVHAASIIGEIINSQIKGLGVGKLEGQITAAQIAANAIIAEKIAAGAVITEKIAAGAITTAKLAAEAITAEKISASAITTSKIAAGAVTAEKLSVIELSAITANLGTVTAGTIKALNQFNLVEGTGSAQLPSSITWGTSSEIISGYFEEETHRLDFQIANANGPHSKYRFMAWGEPATIGGKKGGFAMLEIDAKTGGTFKIEYSEKNAANRITKTIFEQTTGKSSWVQLTEAKATVVNWGNGVVVVAPNSEIRVKHGLGVTPESIQASPAGNTNVNYSIESPNTESFGIKNQHPTFGAAFYWFAMGA